MMLDMEAFDTACSAIFHMYETGSTKSVSTKALQILTSRITDRLECQGTSFSSRCAGVLDNLAANRLGESGFDHDEVKAYLVTVLSLAQDDLRATVEAQGERTVQPVRLRMKSADRLCARSMEVTWMSGNGQTHSWSSWDDQVQNGWYEAEKVLPSDSFAISVQFKIRGLTSSMMKKVDRKNGCKWIKDKLTKRSLVETFNLRAESENATDPVDVTFKLKGPYGASFVQKAWNAARISAPEDWEYWDGQNCPKPEPRLLTLHAADKASPPIDSSEDPLQYLASRQARLNAAARKLVEIRRETINGLRHLDGSITKQWLGVNSANTATAGLAVGSAVTMFIVPPVGIGLGVAAATSGGMTTAADISKDSSKLKAFRDQLSTDNLNTVAVAELESEWLAAREKAVEMADRTASGINGSSETGSRVSGSFMQVGATITTIAAQIADESVVAARGAAVTGAMRAGAIGARVFGVLGAVAATGVAVHGWSTTKFSQKAVRAKLDEMTTSLLCMQKWLAGLGDLECPVCLETLQLDAETRRCVHNFHYFHAQCLEDWCQTCTRHQWSVTCPECRGDVSSDVQTLDEFITSDMQTHLKELSV
jgi:hypothetical protein